MKLFTLTPLFRRALIMFLFAEIVSFLGYYVPSVRVAGFLLLVIAVVVASLVRLEWGVLFVLAELFVGSTGYLFFVEVGSFKLSVRLALFVAVTVVWFVHTLWKRRSLVTPSRYWRWYGLLGAVVVLGVVSALINRLPVRDIFFDANGWFYLVFALPLFSVVSAPGFIQRVLSLFAAATTIMVAKTVFVLFFFSHQFLFIPDLYRWVRDSRVFEVTDLGKNLFRVFSQGHVFAVLAVVAIMVFLILFSDIQYDRRVQRRLWLALFGTSLVAVIGFSRSLLLGVFLTVPLLYWFLVKNSRAGIRRLVHMTGKMLLVLVAVTVLALFIANAPYPWNNPNLKSSGASLIEERVTLSDEGGAGSRWALLRPLAREVFEMAHVLTGAGFGARVTYVSGDPRIVQATGGTVSTYAFEWGYLDIWLKVGLVGLIVYALFVSRIVRHGFALWRSQPRTEEGIVAAGLTFAVICLLLVNLTTPYLNHPLGIGFLIIVSGALTALTPINAERYR